MVKGQVQRNYKRSKKNMLQLMTLSVCFVCPQHNSKTNDPKVFKLGVLQGMTLGYTRWFGG